MKIVIDIPESVIDRAKGKNGLKLCDIDIKFICNQIANGIPLPKGHGDLIDRRELLTKLEWFGESWEQDNPFPNGISAISEDAVIYAEAVIPADKGK